MEEGVFSKSKAQLNRINIPEPAIPCSLFTPIDVKAIPEDLEVITFTVQIKQIGDCILNTNLESPESHISHKAGP